MQTQLQITFRHLTHSDALAAQIRERVVELEHIFSRITSCHAVVEPAGHHHRHGNQYQVLLNVNLPGHEILVTHTPAAEHIPETAQATVDGAFDQVERQLADWMGRQREQRHEVEHGPS